MSPTGIDVTIKSGPTGQPPYIASQDEKRSRIASSRLRMVRRLVSSATVVAFVNDYLSRNLSSGVAASAGIDRVSTLMTIENCD